MVREHESERRARPPLSLSRESGIDHLTKPRGNIQARFMQRLCLVKASQKIIETAHVCSIKYEFGESLSLSHATFYLLELHKIETVLFIADCSHLLGTSESAKNLATVSPAFTPLSKAPLNVDVAI